jgi:hypothetical protein
MHPPQTNASVRLYVPCHVMRHHPFHPLAPYLRMRVLNNDIVVAGRFHFLTVRIRAMGVNHNRDDCAWAVNTSVRYDNSSLYRSEALRWTPGRHMSAAVRGASLAAGRNPAISADHFPRSGLATAATQTRVLERTIREQTGHTGVPILRRSIRLGSASADGLSREARFGAVPHSDQRTSAIACGMHPTTIFLRGVHFGWNPLTSMDDKGSHLVIPFESSERIRSGRLGHGESTAARLLDRLAGEPVPGVSSPR